jgi:hypothetical protein
MITDTPLPFDLPAVRRKKLTVDFRDGNQSSGAGLCCCGGRRLGELAPESGTTGLIGSGPFRFGKRSG